MLQRDSRTRCCHEELSTLGAVAAPLRKARPTHSFDGDLDVDERLGNGKRRRLQEHPRTQPGERAPDSSRHAGMTLVPTPKRWKECARFSGLLQAIGLRQKAELPSGATSLLMKVNYDKVQVEVYDWWERKLAAFQMTTLQVRYVTHRRIGSSL